jgi:hypothetical protein
MREGAAFRGQPLLMLATLLVGWLGLRVALWEPPLEVPTPMRPAQASLNPLALPPARQIELPATSVPSSGPESVIPAPTAWAPLVPAVSAPLAPTPGSDGIGEAIPAPADPLQPSAPLPSRAVIGHNLLLLAGLAQMELPPALVVYVRGAGPTAPGIPAAAPILAAAMPRPGRARASRWSADAWLLLRDDTTSPILSGRPSYGRSQAGAVIRYRLAPDSALRPQAYLRASAALAGAREREVAAGVSARPVAGLPLRLFAEARIGETSRGRLLRPAVYAVTEFPALALPLGLRGEAYAQGGYVGGDYATAFVDGQARVERALVRRGDAELTAGAGLWGGAQEDAARLDIGPTAAVSFRLGPKSSGARGRIAADYRFRVAGDAEPSSGPALTLSAGF